MSSPACSRAMKSGLAPPPPVPAPLLTRIPSGPDVAPNPYGETGAQAPAQEVRRPRLEFIKDYGDVFREVAQATGRVDGKGLGASEATKNDRKSPNVKWQCKHHRLEEQGRGHVAVHEHYRLARVVGRSLQDPRSHTRGFDIVDGSTVEDQFHVSTSAGSRMRGAAVAARIPST